MNVWGKLANARAAFQKLNKKMSGKNKFAGYDYYELADILPEINKLGNELGFVCEVSFSDVAELIFRNTEKPDEIIRFTSPMSSASLKGCHDVQNLGAVQTYIKRYLYQNCFEIVEADSLNATQGQPEKPKADTPDIVALKQALIDYINAGAFEHPENVEAVMKANDIAQMKKALETAKAKEAKK